MAAAQRPLALVAALTKKHVIGKDGAIPWHYPEDMKHFRQVTRDHAIIMGRATYDSIGKPLPGRRNIVLSRDPNLHIEGCEVVPNLQRALELAYERDPEPRVIGGAEVYATALPLATQLYLTYLDVEHEGDAYFPAFDAAAWIEQERRRGQDLTFLTLQRR